MFASDAPCERIRRVRRATVNRQALSGVIIAAVLGIGWAQWGASGLPLGAATVIRAATAVLGVIILIRAFRLRRTAAGGSVSMFASRGYRIVVALEVVALVAGAVVLNRTGHGGYVPAWIAAVVGVHFVGFGWLFARFFYVVGGVIVLGALAAAVVGLAGGSRRGVEAVAGLVTAAALLGAAGWRLAQPDCRGSVTDLQ